MLYHVYNSAHENLGSVILLEGAKPQAVVDALDAGGFLEDLDADESIGVAPFAPNENKAAPDGLEILDSNDDCVLELYPDGHEPDDSSQEDSGEMEGASDDAADLGAVIDGECREVFT